MAALLHASLKFGDIVQLESAVGGRKRYRAQLLGLLPGVTVMVTTPEVDGHPIPVTEGQSFVVRIFTGDEALAFRAGVARSCRHPLHYLHLTYPAAVEKALVRNTRRAKLRLPAQAQLATGESVPVMIDDLSIDGAQLESGRELGAVGERLTITAVLPLDRIGERGVTLPAELKNMKTHPGEDGATLYRYGTRFAEVPVDSDLALTAFVYMQINAQLLGEDS